MQRIWRKNSLKRVLSLSREYRVYFDITWKRSSEFEFWGEFGKSRDFFREQISSCDRRYLDSSEFSSEFSDLKTSSSNVVNPVISWNGQNSFHRIFASNSQDFTTPQISFEFLEFYYTSNSFLIKTNQHKRSENLLISRNLVLAERKRQGQGGVMWTEDHKRSDANHTTWINLMQSNTTHCAKFRFMTAQRSYIDTSTAQVTAPGLFGGFSFRGSVWKN